MYSNLCKPMYLEEDQNSYGILTYMSFIPSLMFYSMFGYYTLKFINYVQDEDKKYIKEQEQNNIDYIKKEEDYKKYYKYQFKNDDHFRLLNDVSLDTTETETEIKKKQDIIDTMLSTKTLERSLVIYYIFIKKGNYKTADSHIEYNSYLEFKKYESSCSFLEKSRAKKQDLGNPARKDEQESSFLEKQDLGNPARKGSAKKQDLGNPARKDDEENPAHTNGEEIFLNIKGARGAEALAREPSQGNFSLDKSLEMNTICHIGSKEYIINEGHLNMISWLYYSGLYDYVTTTIELKYKILKEMFNDNLLTGNLFLRYQLFLQENEFLEDTDDLDNLENNLINLHKEFKIINLDDTDLESINDSSVESSVESSAESSEIDDNDLEEVNLDSELDNEISKLSMEEKLFVNQ